MYWIFITPLSAFFFFFPPSSFGRINIHTYVYGDMQKEKKNFFVRLQEIGYSCYL